MNICEFLPCVLSDLEVIKPLIQVVYLLKLLVFHNNITYNKIYNEQA